MCKKGVTQAKTQKGGWKLIYMYNVGHIGAVAWLAVA